VVMSEGGGKKKCPNIVDKKGWGGVKKIVINIHKKGPEKQGGA